MLGFESVGQILPRVIKRSKAGSDLLALQVRENFGNSLASVFRLQKLPKITAGRLSWGVLTVLVPDPAWSQVVRAKESQILKKLNSTIGRQVVQKLRFKVVTK